MVLPGKAWLEFAVTEENGKRRIIQEAIFNPRALGRRLYWYLISPFHFFVFPTMLRNILKKAATSASIYGRSGGSCPRSFGVQP